MAKLNMKRLELIALKQYKDLLVSKLQRLGVVEPTAINDERLLSTTTKEQVASVEKNIQTVEEALMVLDEFSPPEGSLMDMFKGRAEVDEQEYCKLSETAFSILSMAENIVSLRREVAELKADIVRFETTLSTLEVWRRLDVPLRQKSTAKTSTIIGILPQQYTLESLLMKVAEKCPDDAVSFEIVSSTKQQTAVWAVCHIDSKDRVYSTLREMGLILPTDLADITPRDRIAQLEKQIQSAKTKLEQRKTDIISLANQRDNLKFLFDKLNVDKETSEAELLFKSTDKTVVINGYIPEGAIESVKALAKKYDAVFNLYEPSEDEDVPVMLKNGGFSEPVESITEMYALPGKKDIDPSAIMAFFYYLLFGMMLSDAGYGLVMTVGTWFILKKTSVEGTLRRSLKMFFYCGISTVIWGALFGSWFGDIIPIIYTNFLNKPAPNLALWFEPIKDPIKLLLFSFIIGICHLFLGLIAAGYMKWKEGQKLDAVLDTVPIMLLVLGAAPLAAGVLVSIPSAVTGIAKYVAIAGVVLIILTSARDSKNIIGKLLGGLYGLYNIASGYLSDILSYSRLLALGLATGSIAGVVNMMGAMPQNLVVKGILLTIVFFVGHALNMAINVLGAYVHSNRLQFVELFSKFYEGGGRAFKPLRMNTKFIKLKEENKNE